MVSELDSFLSQRECRKMQQREVNRKSRDFIWGELLSFLRRYNSKGQQRSVDAGSIIIFKTKYVPVFVYLD